MKGFICVCEPLWRISVLRNEDTKNDEVFAGVRRRRLLEQEVNSKDNDQHTYND